MEKRVYCPRCKKDSEEILYLDAAMMVYSCPTCAFKYYGGVPSTCEKCGSSLYGVIGFPMGETDKFPSLCDECKWEIKNFEEEEKLGGIQFTCKCGRSGIIHAKSDFAKDFRKRVERPSPLPCGVELEECPECIKRRIG